MAAHSTPPLHGILLANTGSPASPSPADVRRFLAQFLSDRRIVDLPRWQWLPLLHLVILNTRPRRSAHLYQRIWTAAGSPLIHTTHLLADKLAQYLNPSPNPPGDSTTRDNGALPSFVVAPGMRYGQPSIAGALRRLRDQRINRLTVLPLFPQYSTTTTASIFDAVLAELRTWQHVPRLSQIEHYHDHPAYIQAVAGSIKSHLAALPQSATTASPHLLFSFHGIPQSYAERGDPYPQHCHRSAELVAAVLGLSPAEWSIGFQSRFGRLVWLRPYTSESLQALARQSLPRLAVACPGFAVDCLETLDEIDHEARLTYQSAGGGEFHYLPALNDSPAHVQALAAVFRDHAGI